MHQNSKAAKRYAKALLSFALEKGEEENVAADMKMIRNTCKGSRDFVALLKSPVVKSDKKKEIINSIFGGKIGSITLKFLEVMTQQDREDILPEIASAFERVYRDHQGIVRAEIISAVPLTEKGRNKAFEFVKKFYHNVELTEKVDEDLIGGFIIRVGDKQYDESVARKLQLLKQEFEKNPYISEI